MGVDTILTGVPQFDTLEIVKTGTLTLAKGASVDSQDTTFNHNLGYVPIVIAMYDNGTNTYTLPYLSIDLAGADGGQVSLMIGGAYATDTQIGFTVTTPDNSGSYSQSLTFPVRYYLLRQTSKSS